MLQSEQPSAEALRLMSSPIIGAMSGRRTQLLAALGKQETIRNSLIVSILVAPEYTYAYNYVRNLFGHVDSTEFFFWGIHWFRQEKYTWEEARRAARRAYCYRTKAYPHAHDGFFDQLEPEFLTLTEQAREFLFRREDLHIRIFGPAPD